MFEARSKLRDWGAISMTRERASQAYYADSLEFLKKRHQETDDPEVKQRIQGLLDGEADCQAIAELHKKLKTEAARTLISRASLAYLVKHAFDLAAEVKKTEK